MFFFQKFPISIFFKRFFRDAILLVHPIGHAKNDGQNQSALPIEKQLKNIAFVLYYLNRTCSFHLCNSIKSFCDKAFVV